MEKETTKKETTKKEDEQQQEQEEKHANNNNLQHNDHDKDTSRDNNVINSSNNNNNTITNHQDDETKEDTVTTSNIIVNVPSVVNISINHSNELEFAKRISSSLNAKGYTKTEEDDYSIIGKQMVIAMITDTYFDNAECVQYLRRSKNTQTIIQPVVRFEDKENIGSFKDSAPDDLKYLFDSKCIVLDEMDQEFWDIGIYQIIKKLKIKTLRCNQPGTWDVFIGHSRRSAEATTLAETLDKSFKEKDYSTWLDVKMNDTSLAAMEEGVCNAKLFVAVVTGPCINNNKPNDNPDDNSYFKRWFCIEELRWAIKAGIHIQPVIRAKDREKKKNF